MWLKVIVSWKFRLSPNKLSRLYSYKTKGFLEEVMTKTLKCNEAKYRLALKNKLKLVKSVTFTINFMNIIIILK